MERRAYSPALCPKVCRGFRRALATDCRAAPYQIRHAATLTAWVGRGTMACPYSKVSCVAVTPGTSHPLRDHDGGADSPFHHVPLLPGTLTSQGGFPCETAYDGCRESIRGIPTSGSRVRAGGNRGGCARHPFACRRGVAIVTPSTKPTRAFPVPRARFSSRARTRHGWGCGRGRTHAQFIISHVTKISPSVVFVHANTIL